MTKYWVLTMIGAIGLAALIHPDRLKFLSSPAPWVAIATMFIAMIPHLVWLGAGIRAADLCRRRLWTVEPRPECRAGVGYIGHNVALLAAPVALAAIALTWTRRWWTLARPSHCSRTSGRAAQIPASTARGAQRLDHPVRGRHRAAARRPDLHDLYENRLGDLAVLPDAAGAGRDTPAAHAEGRAVSCRRDLAGHHARCIGRGAHDRHGGDGALSQRNLDLWRAF